MRALDALRAHAIRPLLRVPPPRARRAPEAPAPELTAQLPLEAPQFGERRRADEGERGVADVDFYV
jgi:hypothetical protein